MVNQTLQCLLSGEDPFIVAGTEINEGAYAKFRQNVPGLPTDIPANANDRANANLLFCQRHGLVNVGWLNGDIHDIAPAAPAAPPVAPPVVGVAGIAAAVGPPPVVLRCGMPNTYPRQVWVAFWILNECTGFRA